VIIDALRCCEVAQNRDVGGPLIGPSASFMKSPPIQYRDKEAREAPGGIFPEAVCGP
jgi:myo-inositol-1-phosphate synthase